MNKKREFLLIAAENNAIRSNDVKASIDMTYQTNRYRLYSNRGEMINNVTSKCSKLAHTRLGWVGKEIQWDMCKWV